MRKLRKGDEVVVLVGKDKGERGTISKVIHNMGKVIVENINIAKCHTKANPMKKESGGILRKEMPLDISNIAIWNPLLGKADRVGVKTLKDGQKVRFFKSDGEVIDT